jgi:MFS family permease
MIDRQSRFYPWILLTILSLAYLSASLDRIVISLLVEPIQADLGLSDTEISLLQGLAFVLVFSFASIPFGMMVDRMNRMRLLASGIGMWSIMTAWCGLANNFALFFVARAGVGVGEAVLTPAGYSMISDAFDKKRLGLALSIFMMGGSIGTGLSLVLGGYAVGELSKHGSFHIPLFGVLHPWQLTFVWLAIPGLIIALIVGTLPNPSRKHQKLAAAESTALLARFYRENRAMIARHHIATGLASLALLGGYSWIAPLFTRVYGWQPAEVGLAAGIVSIIGAPIGLLGGGFLGDWLLRFGPYMRLTVCGVSVALAAFCALLYPLVPWAGTAITLFGGMAMFATVPFGVGNAALQHIVPSELRGRISAIYFFSSSIIGMFGPTLIAAISDTFFPFPSGIGFATALVLPTSLLLSAFLWIWSINPYQQLTERIDNPLVRVPVSISDAVLIFEAGSVMK